MPEADMAALHVFDMKRFSVKTAVWSLLKTDYKAKRFVNKFAFWALCVLYWSKAEY